MASKSRTPPPEYENRIPKKPLACKPPPKERFMWLYVFFDLPVQEPEERKIAAKFRHFLLDDGYIMIQFSVYARICNGQDRVDKHMQRLIDALPAKGSIRTLQITDAQYARSRIMVGTAKNNEKAKTAQLVLF